MKKLLAVFSLTMVVLLSSGFTTAVMSETPVEKAESPIAETENYRYRRAEIIRYGGRTPAIRQADDRDTLRRIDQLIQAVWRRERVEKPADVQKALVIRGDLSRIVEEVTFLADGRHMMEFDVCYPCTEEEYQEALSLLEGPAQEKQGFWQLMEGDEITGHVLDWGFCGADTTAAADFLQLIDGQAREEAPKRVAGQEECLQVNIYRGSHPESYVFTPEWIKYMTDYDVYYTSTPALYEKAKEMVGAQNLSFPLPKTLVIPGYAYKGEDIIISDPAKIRALLEPLQGMRPARVIGASCGLEWIPMYLDGDKNRVLTVKRGEVSYSVTGKNYSGIKASGPWRDIFRKVVEQP